MDPVGEFEYTIEKKVKGLKAVFLSVYILLGGGLFAFLCILKLVPVAAIIPLLLWILVFFTWRYTKPEYRYAIVTGKLQIFSSYDGKSEKMILETRLSALTDIQPASAGMTADFSAISFPGASHTFLASVGEKRLLFETVPPAEKIYAFYNEGFRVLAKPQRKD